ncbi:HAD family hydrolase [Saccharopolyspora sp. ASAGF58]|uniref:HAD family hydrolase n=1 Tax=Saccharopolyspora sp. ASAGF58 TaxID=2719023 RepID=UPI002111654C|nr:haloacid dehalogenase-like hydrolase [Saccharopolyspora sp. ASAGF58]
MLLLWDIDRTLVDVSDITLDAFTATVTAVLGREPETVASLTGRSEAASMFETLRGNGFSEDNARAKLPHALQQFMSELAGRMRRLDSACRTARLLPGVRQALREFARQTNVLQSVLTGGLRANAHLKLTAFDLESYLDLSVAAYGDDDFDRAVLVDVARKRASQAAGYEVPVANTVLIGDSLNDVDAGRRSGAQVIAVATGVNSEDELKGVGANEVLRDLQSLQDVRAAVSRCLEPLRWP